MPVAKIMENWLADEEVRRYLKINRFEDVLWFDKERFESFVWWMVLLAAFGSASGPRASASLMVERLLLVQSVAGKLLEAEEKSGYQVAKLLQAL